jgi:cleavage stimulation factor subunit 2
VSKTAFVGNLSFSATEEELTRFFSEAGPVVKARIGTDRETGRSRGFAFVEFADEDGCAAAIQRLNGAEMGGRRLRVNDADDKPPPRSAAPPPTAYRPANAGPRPNIGDRFAARPYVAEPPPPIDLYGAGGAGGGGGGGSEDDFRRRVSGKGSRRGLRARKRSLSG